MLVTVAHCVGRAGRQQRAATLLGEAEALWRGPALLDLADSPFAGPAAGRLDELRLTAAEDRIEAELTLGRGADVLDEVERLAFHDPLTGLPNRRRLAEVLDSTVLQAQVAGTGAAVL